jgi:hypothetical protein
LTPPQNKVLKLKQNMSSHTFKFQDLINNVL